MEISRIRLLVSLGAGIVAISFASILIRFAQAEGVPSLSIAAWRLIFASLVLLPYAWATRCEEILALSRREIRLLLISGLFLGFHFATWIASLAYTSVASSVVLVSMGPVFVGLGSWAFLRERPGLVTAIGILMAAAGSIVISLGDFGRGQDHLLGDLLALTGAVMVAGYLMIGRKVRARRSLVAYIALVYGAAMLTLLAIVLLSGSPLFGFSPRAYLLMLALGLVPQLIGHSTLNWALRHLSATYVSLVTLAEPMASGFLAYLILSEAVTPATAAGGILILAGIYCASRAELPDTHRTANET
jgi:drug/metabolite transporter (DMT)-like permease